MKFKLESIAPSVDGETESTIKVEGETGLHGVVCLGNGNNSAFINLDIPEVRVAYRLLGKVLEFNGEMEDL